MNGKHILSALLALLMILSMLTSIVLPAAADISGIPEDAVSVTKIAESTSTHFTVSTLEELVFASANNTSFTIEDTLYLTTDLDLSGSYTSTVAEGNTFAADFDGFSGTTKFTFDGQGHTISNFTDSHGFFTHIVGYLKNVTFDNFHVDLGSGYGGIIATTVEAGGAVLDNVHLKNSTITSTATCYIGGMIGYMQNNATKDCSVINCSVDNTHITGSENGAHSVGLIAGRMRTGNYLVKNVVVTNSSITNPNGINNEASALLVGNTYSSSTMVMDNIVIVNNAMKTPLEGSKNLAALVSLRDSITSASISNIYAVGNTIDNAVMDNLIFCHSYNNDERVTLSGEFLTDSTNIMWGRSSDTANATNNEFSVAATSSAEGLTLAAALAKMNANEAAAGEVEHIYSYPVVYNDWAVNADGKAQLVNTDDLSVTFRFAAETVVLIPDLATGLLVLDETVKAKIESESWMNDATGTAAAIDWTTAPTASVSYSAVADAADRVSVQEVLTNDTATEFSVSSLKDLIFLANNYASFAAEDTVYLETDLNITEYEGNFSDDFPGIGVSHDKYLKATFNGQNHTIYNYSDTHAFMAAAGEGGLKNLKFDGGTVTLSTYGAFVLGFGVIGADLTATIANVHVKNATVTTDGTGYGVAIMAGGANNKVRHITFENCSVENCVVNAPNLTEMAGIFMAREGDKVTGSLTMNNIVVANSTLIANNDDDCGGGLLISGIRRPNIPVTLTNIAMIGNKLVNGEHSQAAIITSNEKFAWSDGYSATASNIIAVGNMRSIDGQETWAPMNALFNDNHHFWTVELTNAITDAGVTYEVLGHSRIVNNSNIRYMNKEAALAALNVTADADWTVETGSIVLTADTAPVTVTFTFTDGREIRLGSANGTLSADDATKAKIDSEVWAEGFVWSNTFTADTAYTALKHNITYAVGEGTHTASCADCTEAAHNGTFACADITDSSTAVKGDYFREDVLSYTCVCGNTWNVKDASAKSPVSPINATFNKESYSGSGVLADLAIGSRSDTKLTGFTVEVTYDPALLEYQEALSPYDVSVRGENGELTVVLSGDRELNAESVYLRFKTLDIAADCTVTAAVTMTDAVVNYADGLTAADALVTENSASAMLIRETAPENFIAGDINSDNKFSLMDAALMLQALSGTIHKDQAFEVWAADVDGDLAVTVNDLATQLKALVDSNITFETATAKPSLLVVNARDYAGYVLPAEDADYSGYLKIMTYNLKLWNNYSNNLDEAAEYIKETNPDIVGFQEIDSVCGRSDYVDQIKELAEQCGYPYYHFAKNTTNSGGEYGNAFMSKYPIVNYELINFEVKGDGDHNRSYCHYQLDIDGKILHVFNTHLTRTGGEAGAAEIRQMQADAAQYPYAVMMGDLNINAQDLVDCLDTDTFLALNGGLDFETVVNTFSSSEPTRAIDNIIVSRKLLHYWNHDAGVGVETSIQPNISDHNCLYSWIKIPD